MIAQQRLVFAYLVCDTLSMQTRIFFVEETSQPWPLNKISIFLKKFKDCAVCENGMNKNYISQILANYWPMVSKVQKCVLALSETFFFENCLIRLLHCFHKVKILPVKLGIKIRHCCRVLIKTSSFLPNRNCRAILGGMQLQKRYKSV